MFVCLFLKRCLRGKQRGADKPGIRLYFTRRPGAGSAVCSHCRMSPFCDSFPRSPEGGPACLFSWNFCCQAGIRVVAQRQATWTSKAVVAVEEGPGRTRPGSPAGSRWGSGRQAGVRVALCAAAGAGRCLEAGQGGNLSWEELKTAAWVSGVCVRVRVCVFPVTLVWVMSKENHREDCKSRAAASPTGRPQFPGLWQRHVTPGAETKDRRLLTAVGAR